MLEARTGNGPQMRLLHPAGLISLFDLGDEGFIPFRDQALDVTRLVDVADLVRDQAGDPDPTLTVEDESVRQIVFVQLHHQLRWTQPGPRQEGIPDQAPAEGFDDIDEAA